MEEYYNPNMAHEKITATGETAVIVPLATAQMLGVVPQVGPEGKR